MKQKRLKRAKETAIKFKRELKKSMVTAIVAAFGFLIALSWRDVVVSGVEKFSQLSPVKGNLITATIITIISVMGILIISRLNNEEKSK